MRKLFSLCHICNLSFQVGKFPEQMKIAKVIPLYKSGERHHFTNNRPVSLLPRLSKILEKLFVGRLDTFINKHKLLSESQYGFRSQRSTAMAVLELIEEVTSSLDKKKFAVGVFIDLKKAFDTINHEILIKKLERYGIRGVVLHWKKSYLSNRQQFVQMGDCQSSCLDIVVSPRGQYWDQNCLFFILMTSVKFLKYLILFCLKMILIFFVQVIICSSFWLKST